MEACIKAKWKLKVHIDLHIGVKGFHTIMFTTLQDHSREFENGPYFLNNVSLFIRFWMPHFNPKKEKFLA